MSIYLRYLAAAAESVSVICWLLSVASEGIGVKAGPRFQRRAM